IVYRRGVPVAGVAQPEAVIDRLFARNGWGNSWVNGIYNFQHYHATVHEVLGIARGRGSVQFGGPEGRILEIEAGDVVIIPAGVGHCRLASKGLSVVGAYPQGSSSIDLRRANAADLAGAAELIARVPLPPSDPVHGRDGPLPKIWRSILSAPP
ncbi:MAG TPA: cupin domain-containing protein, partial [Hyphomicrobiaceae bacterium]|nr:cupin domain-containing protein [Hyphomicrobiaceae bacterium]